MTTRSSRQNLPLGTPQSHGGNKNNDVDGSGTIRRSTRSRSSYEKAYPGSAVKANKRRSFRTPIQTLPLPSSSESQTPENSKRVSKNSSSYRRSASKSFLLMSEDENQEYTPRTVIQQFLNFDSEKSNKRESVGIPRKTPFKVRSDDLFKVPLSQKVLRKSSIGISTTPIANENETPRTLVQKLLMNAGEEESLSLGNSLSKNNPVSLEALDDQNSPSTSFEQVSISPFLGNEEAEVDNTEVKSYLRKSMKRNFQLQSQRSYTNIDNLDNDHSADSVENMSIPQLSDSLESERIDGTVSSSLQKKKRKSFHIPFVSELETNSKEGMYFFNR